jgi:hypothetical protein
MLMRHIRLALALVLVLFVAGAAFAQQPTQQTEQQTQGQQQQQRQGPGGQGGGGQGRGGDGGGAIGGRGGQAAGPPPTSPGIENYVNTDDLFSLSVPCKFTAKSITWETEYGTMLPGNVYSCNKGAEEYSMSVINYTDIAKLRAEQEHTPAARGGGYARIDLHASIAYAATKLRNEAAKVTYDAWHYINLIPGHELQTTLANGNRVYSAIYLHEYRLYIMKATVPADGIPPLLFTQSLAIIRPDGGGIRYQSIYRHPW